MLAKPDDGRAALVISALGINSAIYIIITAYTFTIIRYQTAADLVGERLSMLLMLLAVL